MSTEAAAAKNAAPSKTQTPTNAVNNHQAPGGR